MRYRKLDKASEIQPGAHLLIQGNGWPAPIEYTALAMTPTSVANWGGTPHEMVRVVFRLGAGINGPHVTLELPEILEPHFVVRAIETGELPGDLDPGIRDLVELLHRHHFPTSDSGDGYSKIGGDMDGPDGCVLPFPHIAISVHADRLLSETARLRELILRGGSRADREAFRGWSIEPSFVVPMGEHPIEDALILLSGPPNPDSVRSQEFATLLGRLAEGDLAIDALRERLAAEGWDLLEGASLEQLETLIADTLNAGGEEIKIKAPPGHLLEAEGACGASFASGSITFSAYKRGRQDTTFEKLRERLAGKKAAALRTALVTLNDELARGTVISLEAAKGTFLVLGAVGGGILEFDRALGRYITKSFEFGSRTSIIVGKPEEPNPANPVDPGGAPDDTPSRAEVERANIAALDQFPRAVREREEITLEDGEQLKIKARPGSSLDIFGEGFVNNAGGIDYSATMTARPSNAPAIKLDGSLGEVKIRDFKIDPKTGELLIGKGLEPEGPPEGVEIGRVPMSIKIDSVSLIDVPLPGLGPIKIVIPDERPTAAEALEGLARMKAATGVNAEQALANAAAIGAALDPNVARKASLARRAEEEAARKAENTERITKQLAEAWPDGPPPGGVYEGESLDALYPDDIEKGSAEEARLEAGFEAEALRAEAAFERFELSADSLGVYINAAFNEGVASIALKASANPYAEGSKIHKAWNAGREDGVATIQLEEMKKERERRAYDLGRSAGISTSDVQCCPFEHGSEIRRLWILGFEDGLSEVADANSKDRRAQIDRTPESKRTLRLKITEALGLDFDAESDDSILDLIKRNAAVSKGHAARQNPVTFDIEGASESAPPRLIIGPDGKVDLDTIRDVGQWLTEHGQIGICLEAPKGCRFDIEADTGSALFGACAIIVKARDERFGEIPSSSQPLEETEALDFDKEKAANESALRVARGFYEGIREKVAAHEPVPAAYVADLLDDWERQYVERSAELRAARSRRERLESKVATILKVSGSLKPEAKAEIERLAKERLEIERSPAEQLEALEKLRAKLEASRPGNAPKIVIRRDQLDPDQIETIEKLLGEGRSVGYSIGGTVKVAEELAEPEGPPEPITFPFIFCYACGGTSQPADDGKCPVCSSPRTIGTYKPSGEPKGDL